jgi:hypothetical protein
MGFGILMRNAGYGVVWAAAMSIFMYAGSMQYVGVGLLTGGASVLTTAITTFMVNARHLFYSISMINTYKDAGKYKPFMIFALTVSNVLAGGIMMILYLTPLKDRLGITPLKLTIIVLVFSYLSSATLSVVINDLVEEFRQCESSYINQIRDENILPISKDYESFLTSIRTMKSESYKSARFSLDGRRLTSPQKGINIIHQSDGTVRKEIVR